MHHQPHLVASLMQVEGVTVMGCAVMTSDTLHGRTCDSTIGGTRQYMVLDMSSLGVQSQLLPEVNPGKPPTLGLPSPLVPRPFDDFLSGPSHCQNIPTVSSQTWSSHSLVCAPFPVKS